MEDINTNKPAFSIRYGVVRAAVWRNTVENGEVTGTFYSVTFTRSYRTTDDQWHDAQSFGMDELLLVAKAADKCHSWISKQMALESSGKSAARAPRRLVVPASPPPGGLGADQP